MFNCSLIIRFLLELPNTHHLEIKVETVSAQARETGICPVRRELYTQCFDEIIRQVTINCAERGLLLLRVRDEMRMTIEAYQALYCSSIAFGMRKALQAEQGKSDLEAQVEQLKNEKLELEHQIIELKQRAEQADRRAAETRMAEERKHTEEIAFLKKTNMQLKVKAFSRWKEYRLFSFNLKLHLTIYSRLGLVKFYIIKIDLSQYLKKEN